ncbi:IS3 family transposase [Bacillus thuringiensis]|uniref:IS3 family transposase n=1 Tax=Bacillus thuringiensis TaxID=1428 RepID=UPI0011A9D65A|nr:IS3 family transposase [Bacillus thuringiensis]
MARMKYSKAEKLAILALYKDGHHSIADITAKFSVDPGTIRDWKRRYEVNGEDGLEEALSWKRYSKELKLAAVNDYLSGHDSLNKIIQKYNISSTAVLRKWIKKYNSHRELNDTSKGMTNSMTSRRKTTLEERIQIVNYCIQHQKNYQLTAESYEVSYQQVYQWVKKFEANGEEALQDKRGRKKEEYELTAEEKFKLEMKRLERENERLRAEKCFFKKVRRTRKEASLTSVRLQNKYRAIQDLHANENLAVILLCEIAGVSRAAYYKWLQRTPTARELENEAILLDIQAIYARVEGIYGYRRMKLNINRIYHKKFNHKRIYRLMHIAGLQSVIRRKRKRYVPSTAQYVAENRLNREFTASKPNEKWVTDVTEFKLGNGRKTYLSAILDLYDGSIISYVLGHSNNNKLVFQTLDQAITILKENEHPLIHSDRGYQYTSHGFKRKIEKAKMIHSMSRVGKCIDNGPMESFWGTLKCEKYYLHKYETFEALQQAIDNYIQFYNNERYQEKLNGLSPLEYRVQAA